MPVREECGTTRERPSLDDSQKERQQHAVEAEECMGVPQSEFRIHRRGGGVFDILVQTIEMRYMAAQIEVAFNH